MVDFCDSCGAIIVGKKGEDFVCPGCGKVYKSLSSINLSQKVENKKEIEIIDEKSQEEVHPLIDTSCPNCEHKKAHYWTKQTRAGDEPETLFYKCEKCKHQWRDYK